MLRGIRGWNWNEFKVILFNSNSCVSSVLLKSNLNSKHNSTKLNFKIKVCPSIGRVENKESGESDSEYVIEQKQKGKWTSKLLLFYYIYFIHYLFIFLLFYLIIFFSFYFLSLFSYYPLCHCFMSLYSVAIYTLYLVCTFALYFFTYLVILSFFLFSLTNFSQ